MVMMRYDNVSRRQASSPRRTSISGYVLILNWQSPSIPRELLLPHGVPHRPPAHDALQGSIPTCSSGGFCYGCVFQGSLLIARDGGDQGGSYSYGARNGAASQPLGPICRDCMGLNKTPNAASLLI
ncbi:unnamed protein product [Boreogadus saida]